MIGVVAEAAQQPIVEEFFQLFKTPWERYEAVNSYDVVLTTVAKLPEITAPLVLVYGATETSIDAGLNLRPQSSTEQRVRSGNDVLPIYSKLAWFPAAHCDVICSTSAGEAAALRMENGSQTIIRIGFDLFEEIRVLLTTGQPVETAEIPTLDLHISCIRDWIVNCGSPLVEIPPVPAGYEFAVSLSHDIDFIGIRDHKFDHTMFGFLYRALVGSMLNFFRRRGSLGNMWKSWKAAASLPFVYLGWARDFWWPFDWYLDVEKGLGATYYFIPFKRRAGENVTVADAPRRASAYDVADIPQALRALKEAGCELGVHGIDAWHSVEKGREELERVASCTGGCDRGIRMHWLLQNAQTFSVLERAGFSYDSTFGYNETVGYRAGTGQVYRPPGVERLLELPMHIQDGALFFPGRLNINEEGAARLCEGFIARARRLGGVITVIWHDRSHAAERFWGEFYARLVASLRAPGVWFGTGEQITSWFRRRREVVFERQGSDIKVHAGSATNSRLPAMRLRMHGPGVGEKIALRDVIWEGNSSVNVSEIFSQRWDAREAQALAK